MADLLLGQVLSFTADPFVAGESAARHESHGAVLVDQGRILATGPADTLRAAHPQARLHDYGRCLITAGFIDAHVHYPQTAIIASWGKRLIDWLNLYTFPEEMRFADPAYADMIANRYLDLATAHGTTTVCTYATIHPASRGRHLHRRADARDAPLRREDLHGQERPRWPARHRAIRL